MTGDEDDLDNAGPGREPITVAELGDRVCAMLDEAARSGAGIDYALLAAGMTACWDSLQPYLGPADDELVRDLLAMRGAGLSQLVHYPYAGEAELIEFAQRLVADAERVLGSGHPDTWDAQRNLAHSYGRCQRLGEAITALAQLSADIERVLPADDGEALAARSDLGIGYMNAGRYQDAIREFFSVLADYERVMGPHNSWTLHARRKLGEAYLEAGLVAEGVELLEAAAAGLSAIVGPDDPRGGRHSPGDR